MRTPNHALKEDYHFGPLNDKRTLPRGSYVKVIEDRNLPKHILDSSDYKWLDPSLKAWCYTRYGIVAVDRNLLEER